MAYIQGFKYDIFISYAHVDNLTASEKEKGWIEQFYNYLVVSLAKRAGRIGKVNIWWDSKKLGGNTTFDSSIENGIRDSAIMICLHSPGYLESDYCKKELNAFFSKSKQEEPGLVVGDQSRIFNVLLNNIPFNKWPQELSGTSGFPFHTAKDASEFGDPLSVESTDFRKHLEKLRDSLINIFEEINNKKTAVSAPIHANTEKKKKEFTIYFGEVADTLRTTSKRTINELEKKGFEVISGIPPPFENDAHEKTVKEKILSADLSVHLLDQYPGKEIIDSPGIWYPQQQAALGLSAAKSKMIWVPADLDINEIEEEHYKEFISSLDKGEQSSGNYEFIRGNKSSLTQQILDLTEQLKAQQQAPQNSTQISVLLDTHFNDQLYAMELGKTLLENKIQPFINPQEDDPRKNINMLADLISKVKKLIFFYGKVNKEWVQERMNAALQLIVANNYPVEEFYVYLAPPYKDPGEIGMKQRYLKLNVFDNSNSTQMDAKTIDSMLRNLKGDQA